jgi:hypothetical protein
MWQIMTGRINNNNVEFDEGFMLDSNLRDVIYNLCTCMLELVM